MKMLESKDVNLCIGKISVLVILPSELDHQLNDEEIKYVENVVLKEYSTGLEKRGLAEILSVGDAESEYGCLIVTIPVLVKFGSVLAAGYAGVKGIQAIKNFIIEYPQIKAGAKEIAKDFKYLKLKLRGKSYEQGNCVRKSEFKTKEEIEEAAEEAINELEKYASRNM